MNYKIKQLVYFHGIHTLVLNPGGLGGCPFGSDNQGGKTFLASSVLLNGLRAAQAS